MTSREQLLWKSIPDNNMFVPIDAMKVVFSRINFQGDCSFRTDMTSREQLLWKSIPDNNMFVPIDAMKVVFSRINFQGDCNDIDHNMDNINNDNDHEEGNDDKLFGQHINNCHHQPTILTYLTHSSRT